MENNPVGLVALATELEKEGQYNTAKLVRAAAVSMLNHASITVRVPSDTGSQADVIESLASELAGSPAAGLAESLNRAAMALREGRVALLAEAPDPYVCRICGATRVGSFTERCPGCGRWPWAAERIRPIYWIRESTVNEALDRLRTTPTEIQALVAGRSDDDLAQPAPDGGWSAQQTLEHLNNAQGVFRGRIDQLLAGGEPQLRSIMVWRMDGTDRGPTELLEDYLTLRREILDLLEAAPLVAFDNRGSHEEWGWVTLAEQASYFANHEPTHLAQIADALP